ncbi:MAG: hypothetical protein JWM19_1922 [Actinomycetia bacterium]|nr:hypothetical protein [Actinomycetes bacterium]
MANGKPTLGQVSSWRATGYPYKLIAAAIAEWAAGKERGTVLPDDEFFRIEASASTYKRAKRFLATQGVLETSDGPFQVALQDSRPAVSRRPGGAPRGLAR